MHEFCRAALKECMKDVRKHTTVEQRKAVYTMPMSLTKTKRYQFFGPDDFYWYGQACCAWHARFEGWNAWMEKEIK